MRVCCKRSCCWSEVIFEYPKTVEISIQRSTVNAQPENFKWFWPSKSNAKHSLSFSQQSTCQQKQLAPALAECKLDLRSDHQYLYGNTFSQPRCRLGRV